MRLVHRIWPILAFAATPAFAARPPATDSQVWTEGDVTVSVAPRLSTTLEAVARLGEGLANPSLAGGGGTLDYRLGAWTLTVGDLWVAARAAASGGTTDVDLPLVAASYGWSALGVAFSARGRFEALVGAPGDPWRYRNRLSVEKPLAGFGPIRSVFASDEAFYDFERDRWSRNRASVGLGLAASRRMAWQIYYMRQDDRFSHPSALNILGVAFKADLR